MTGRAVRSTPTADSSTVFVTASCAKASNLAGVLQSALGRHDGLRQLRKSSCVLSAVLQGTRDTYCTYCRALPGVVRSRSSSRTSTM